LRRVARKRSIAFDVNNRTFDVTDGKSDVIHHQRGGLQQCRYVSNVAWVIYVIPVWNKVFTFIHCLPLFYMK
jgi:hypothetical protein